MTDDNITYDNTTPAPETEEPISTPDPEVVADDSGAADMAEAQDDDTTQPSGSEAAKYRRRLRDTEKERDELAARVEAIQRHQVETLLHRERMTPKALWATTELAELLTDDGLVDQVKLKTAVQAARKELGIDTGLYVPAEGKVPKPPSGNSFTTAFKPPTNR